MKVRVVSGKDGAVQLLLPSYDKIHTWELYSEELQTEYRQCMEEGLDISAYEAVFASVAALERSAHKDAIADALFDVVSRAPQVADYPYTEPSDLAGICEASAGGVATASLSLSPQALREKIEGAWYGRICGCLLGKTLEGIKLNELIPFLKETGNYPLTRYVRRSEITDEMLQKYKYKFAKRCYADTVTHAPSDDDTNYMVLYQQVVEKYGRDFTPDQIAEAWVAMQPKIAYCTAERVAFRNFVAGYLPPMSAIYKNPYREWIGAQIRADYFGYINPGDPDTAAEMAWRDASISHTKNGIYGEMFVAAMIAAAAVEKDLKTIIRIGLSKIPTHSRLHNAVTHILAMHESGASAEACFADIQSRWNDQCIHDWCHTVSNAEIVVASLLYGENDYSRSICMAVEAGFDTDCNGATVGSILGMKNGIHSIDPVWLAPINNKLDTSIFGLGTVEISALVEKTLAHIESK